MHLQISFTPLDILSTQDCLHARTYVIIVICFCNYPDSLIVRSGFQRIREPILDQNGWRGILALDGAPMKYVIVYDYFSIIWLSVSALSIAQFVAQFVNKLLHYDL